MQKYLYIFALLLLLVFGIYCPVGCAECGQDFTATKFSRKGCRRRDGQRVSRVLGERAMKETTMFGRFNTRGERAQDSADVMPDWEKL